MLIIYIVLKKDMEGFISQKNRKLKFGMIAFLFIFYPFFEYLLINGYSGDYTIVFHVIGSLKYDSEQF